VAIGEAAGEVEACFAGVRPVRRAASMAEAVRLAAELAEPGDTVLLSPACASFDWYTSYAARGDDFAREVAALPGVRGCSPTSTESRR
jgi:UDP-N-acetylmuramoylalanine--D-glutamate ligase